MSLRSQPVARRPAYQRPWQRILVILPTRLAAVLQLQPVVEPVLVQRLRLLGRLVEGPVMRVNESKPRMVQHVFLQQQLQLSVRV